MSYSTLPMADALGPFRSIYVTILAGVQDTLGIDPAILINTFLAIAAIVTFVHYTSTRLYRYAQRIYLSQVHINDDDQLYGQVMKWMKDHQLKKRAFRSVKATTPQRTSWEDEQEATKRIENQDAVFDPARLISYRSIIARLPIYLHPFEGSHLFRHKGSWILFSHRLHKPNPLILNPRENGYIQLECLGRSLQPLQVLLADIQKYNLDKSMTTTSINRALAGRGEMIRWSHVASRPSRDIRTVIMAQEKKQALLKDINEYLHPRTKRWYANHGIPYRRGYLFSGAPGMGKTSLTFALAGVFGLDIHVLSLLDPAMTDSQLLRVMTEVPTRCIVLLEDVDAAGLGKRSNVSDPAQRKKGAQESKGQDASAEAIEAATDGIAPAPMSSVSLSGLLNAIDGVASHEGRILIMTTNVPDSLDKALTRPGRVDMHINFELPTRAELKELFLSMYCDEEGDMDLSPLSTHGSKKHLEKDSSKGMNGNAGKSASGLEEKHISDLSFSPTDELEEMAERFAGALPSGRLSLADVQGFMLRYKQQPLEACEHAGEWAEAKLREME